MEGTRIKPFVEEISLAYNPANRKKFMMRKEAEGMDKLIEILQNDEELFKEAEVDAALAELSKAKQISDDAQKAVKGALKILNKYKEEVPEGIMSSLARLVPEYGSYAAPSKKEEEVEKEIQDRVNEALEKERDKIREEVKAEMQKDDNAKVEQLEKDVENFKSQLEDANKQIETERDARRLMELTKEVEEFGAAVDTNETAKMLLMAEKSNPELYESIKSQLAKSGEALKATGYFSEVGSAAGGGDEGDTPYDQLKKKVDELMQKDDSLESTAAWEKVCRDNPELYRDYTKSRAH